MNTITIAPRLALRLHRVAAGLSQGRLAAMIGRSPSFVQTMETGKHPAPISDLDWDLIAGALGVDRADIDT